MCYLLQWLLRSCSIVACMADEGSGRCLALILTLEGPIHHSLCTVLTVGLAAIYLSKNSARILIMHPKILIMHPA